MISFQNGLKARERRRDYARDSSEYWKNREETFVGKSDEELWSSLVREVEVNVKDDICFIFKNELE